MNPAQLEAAAARSALADKLGFPGLAEWLPSRLKPHVETAVKNSGASEGTLWFFDPDASALRPVVNIGGDARRMIDEVVQPAGEGLIGMVFASGQPFCENRVRANPDHSPQVDELMGVTTVAMIAVPVAFADELRGVLSLVHLDDESRAFGRADIGIAVTAAAAIGERADREIDERIANG